MDVDSSLKIVGLWGRLQITNLVLFGLGYGLAAIQQTGIAFTIDQSIEHYCKPPAGFTANETTPFIYKEGKEVPDSCHVYEVLNGTLTENITACQKGWEYSTTESRGETSIVTDLNLVCDRAFLATTLTSMHFAGILVGGFVTGQAGDLLGRRVVSMTTLLLAGAIGTAISFTWNFQLMLALRFLLGVALPGNSIGTYVRAIEMFTPKKRVLGNAIFQHFWSLGVIIVPLMAYLLPNWRNFQLTTSLMCLPVVLLMWFFTYESLRWLVQKGRLEKAEAILQKIAKSQNIRHEGGFLLPRGRELSQLPEGAKIQEQSILLEVPDAKAPTEGGGKEESEGAEGLEDGGTGSDVPAKGSKKYTILDLFKTRVLIKRTCIVYVCWFVINLMYYGFVVYTTSLAGNKYLNFFLLAIAEILSYSHDFFVVRRFGRRRPLIFFFFAAAVACFLTGFLPAKTANGSDLTALIVSLAVLGKFYANASFEVSMLVVTEVFPTVLRHVAIGSSSTVGRVSALVAPFIVYLKHVRSFLPLTIFGTLSLTACACVYLLPETKNKPLPETYEDATRVTRGHDEESAP